MNKNRVSKCVFSLLVAGSLSVQAKSTWQSEVAQLVKQAPVPELAFRGAQIVKNAPSKEQTAATIAVVKAVLAKSPSSAALLVGTISDTAPELAAIAAATATTLQPSQANQITAAAVKAAPQQTKQIVQASATSMPVRYNQIALGASRSNPSARHDILSAVEVAVPAVSHSMAAGKSANASVSATIIQSERALQKGSVSPTVALSASSSPIGSPEFRGPGTPGPDFVQTPAVTTTYNTSDTSAAGNNRTISSDGTPEQ